MKKNKIEKIVDEKQKDSIPIGIDYVLTEDNKPYLLEINLKPGGLEVSEFGDSIVNVFISACCNKDHQHQIFNGMMPEFTQDKDQFGSFLKAKEKVVYKKVQGSMGSGVSVIERPEWEPDILEEFIPPKILIKNRKHYPFVLRDLVYLDIKEGNLSWDIRETFRKKSKIAIEDKRSPNETFKLNTMSEIAERAKASKEEIKVTNASTTEVMKKLIEAGKNCSWKPTKIFQKIIIPYYFGYCKPFFAGKPDYINKIETILKKQNIETYNSFFTGDLEERMQNILFGSDAVILPSHHSFKDYSFDISCGQRIKFYLKRDTNGEIVERYSYNRRINRRFPKLENLFVEGEKPIKEIAESMAKIYHRNRLINN
jgi:hypothetical protein